MNLFKPVVHMMSRLKYIERFSFVGFILGFPIIIVAFILMYHVSEDIESFEARQNGVNYNYLLKDLLQDVQQYRELSMRYINGDHLLKSAMEEKQTKIVGDFQVIEQYHQTTDFQLTTMETFSVLKRQWENISSSIEHVNIQSVMDLQKKYIEMIIDYIVDIADYSGIFLTDKHDVYYLVNDIVNVLPNLTDQLGQVRALGMRIMTEKEISEQDKGDLTSFSFSIKRYLKELKHGHDVIFNSNPSLKKRLNNKSHTIRAEVIECLDHIQWHLIEKESFIGSNKYFNLMTELINATFALYNNELMALKSKVDEEVSQLKWKRVLMLLLMFFSFILTSYCFIGFYHSIHRHVEEIKTAGYLFLYRYMFFPQMKKAKNKCKETELKLHQVEKKLSRLVLQGQEEERKRVSRELHDGIGQSLYSILVTLTVGGQDLSPENQTKYLQQAKQLTIDAMEEVKRMTRSLRPSILDDLGLIPALRSYIESYQKVHGIKVIFDVTGDRERVQADGETTLYRIFQEALTNIAKHAQASLVHISIHKTEDHIFVTIQDNGVGFNINHFFKDNDHQGIGLLSMKERAEAHKGTMKIISKINQGTTISVSIPNK